MNLTVRSYSALCGHPICRENLPNGDFVESGLITLVMVASLVAVGRDHRVLISAAVLFIPAIAGKWLNHFFPDYVSPFYFPVFGIAFFAFTIDRNSTSFFKPRTSMPRSLAQASWSI